MFWKTLTYPGDSMLLIPTAIMLALIISFKSSDKRTVWRWILTFGLAGLIVSLSKIAFLGFGIGSALQFYRFQWSQCGVCCALAGFSLAIERHAG
ncbi:hypothetical protein SAMN05216516_105183 [Izhakiella capsodis]|uniref:Uncharacterized protein n=1 Tax=Izhakiella capsodis TaxID=1367852 RepID=A0A1I4Y4T9_9GAMM|nr:hypothetical protein SAMN05216516_105183 [Izhakiella capsodis]